MPLTDNDRALLRQARAALDAYLPTLADTPARINDNAGLLRAWKEGAYSAGDLREHQGIPYKCVQAHDSTVNPGWTPDAVPALWMQYHGTSPETARPWLAPAGAHDQYKAGEYMIWTDGKLYQCLSDTAYSPADYAAAWKAEDAGGGDSGGEGDEYPAFVQPTGAHDAYNAGDKVTFEGKRYVCKMANCAYSPSAYPAGWEEVTSP